MRQQAHLIPEQARHAQQQAQEPQQVKLPSAWGSATTVNRHSHRTVSRKSTGMSESAESQAKGTLSSWVATTASPQSHPCTSGRSEQLTDLLLDWIVDSTRPLSVVGDVGLKAFEIHRT